MCDRKILSSDPHDWDELISEAAGAEKYSRRLSERITDGYAAKFDHRDDPGGHAGLGFRRLPEPPHTLDVDLATIGVAVALFQRYALGNVSAAQLEAETGLAATRIRMILMNPLYNGWIIRHRRSDRESRKLAPWRASPPVSDDLWARVEDVRRARTRGGDQGTVTGSISSGDCSRASVGGDSATTGRSAMAATASTTRTRARPGAARPASATRPGRRRCWPRSPPSRSTRTRLRRSSQPSGRAASRSRSTRPGSSARCASSRWSMPPAD